jgi:predicted phosphoribosyltransferase
VAPQGGCFGSPARWHPRWRADEPTAGSTPIHLAELEGRPCLLVDDGLATGATMIAAVRWARSRGARRVVAAAPVGASSTVQLLRREADTVICPNATERFIAVGLWYSVFGQVGDEDVVRLLAEAREPATA